MPRAQRRYLHPSAQKAAPTLQHPARLSPLRIGGPQRLDVLERLNALRALNGNDLVLSDLG
jgi:hypothetical protein